MSSPSAATPVQPSAVDDPFLLSSAIEIPSGLPQNYPHQLPHHPVNSVMMISTPVVAVAAPSSSSSLSLPGAAIPTSTAAVSSSTIPAAAAAAAAAVPAPSLTSTSSAVPVVLAATPGAATVAGAASSASYFVAAMPASPLPASHQLVPLKSVDPADLKNPDSPLVATRSLPTAGAAAAADDEDEEARSEASAESVSSGGKKEVTPHPVASQSAEVKEVKPSVMVNGGGKDNGNDNSSSRQGSSCILKTEVGSDGLLKKTDHSEPQKLAEKKKEDDEAVKEREEKEIALAVVKMVEVEFVNGGKEGKAETTTTMPTMPTTTTEKATENGGRNLIVKSEKGTEEAVKPMEVDTMPKEAVK